MSWPVDAPTYNFNVFSISVNAPAQAGVYAVFDARKHLLLIDAGEVQYDLLRLAEGGDDEDLHEARPAYFSFVVASLPECEGLKRRLTYPRSFDPGLNRVPDITEWSAPRT